MGAGGITGSKDEFQRILKRDLGSGDGIIGALVSSSDGHVVSQWLPGKWGGGDLAAMSSSLMALAESAAARANLSPCGNLIIENAKGNMILLRVDNELTLTCVAGRDVNLGLQLSACRACAIALRQQVETSAAAAAQK